MTSDRAAPTDTGDIRYAEHGGAHLAYRMVGDGPPLLYVPSQFIPIAAFEEEPAYDRFLARLASFATVIVFDRRGVGLSDPMVDEPTLDDWAAQLGSVLDAAGVDSAYVLGHAWGGLAAVTFAATRPGRVRGLVLAMATGARGTPMDVAANDVLSAARPSRPATSLDLLSRFSPTRAGDIAFQRWWASAGQRGASPAVAQQLLTLQLSADVTSLVPKVRVPTLVIDRPNSHLTTSANRPFGTELGDARVVEVDGVDALVWLPDSHAVTAEIEDFLTGERHAAPPQRQLLTIMFNDVVGSTDAAVRLGDDHWCHLLDAHDRLLRSELERHGGVDIDTAGDGFLSTFTTPTAAAHCAARLHRGMADLGLQMRAGIHCGEVERRGDNFGGIAMHIGARVQAKARPGETWVTSTVKEVMTGSGFTFAERGAHELKGVPGRWHLYAV